MGKLSRKNEAQLYHTISVLSSLLLDYLEKLPRDSETLTNYKEALKSLEEIAEKIVDAAYVEEIKSDTYIQMLCNKIDTIIRRNFKQI